jgi:hypothetical protein
MSGQASEPWNQARNPKFVAARISVHPGSAEARNWRLQVMSALREQPTSIIATTGRRGALAGNGEPHSPAISGGNRQDL